MKRRPDWTEDDATYGCEGHETVSAAYRRLVGHSFNPKDAEYREDLGDADYYRMPNGVEVVVSYPGNNSITLPEGFQRADVPPTAGQPGVHRPGDAEQGGPARSRRMELRGG